MLNIWDYISFIVTCVCFYIYFRGLASGWIWQCKLCNHEIIQFPKEPINIYELNYMCTIKIRMHPNIIIPETFKGINALCPTKSSQNWCPKIIRTLPDQSRWKRELVVQVKMYMPSEIQHLSVYIPGPSHLPEPEQCPKDHPTSDEGLYIETSKHSDSVSDMKTYRIL